MSHRYRGHRANSFQAADLTELVELRARQRTFHGAYSRTALSNLGFSLTILRLFDPRFHRSQFFFAFFTSVLFMDPFYALPAVGLLFAVLGAALYVLAFLRARHSRHDFADYEKPEDCTTPSARRPQHVICTKGQENTRIFGRPFVTAGSIVIGVAAVVAGVEIGLLVLVLKI
ncbi:hypothetical protein MSAN_00571800 [Mycena sanguinolenta]|uniref:DUF202 domain-containing protein n=1 Tax=Mycena sanguinolenta TaxID=230812 RepID=A0A8H7DFK2_9AGAR|nr:hypothetical protein MSAN_00571800 [Mycena sanguinolenta]